MIGIPDGVLFSPVGRGAALACNPGLGKDNFYTEQAGILAYSFGVSISLVSRTVGNDQLAARILEPANELVVGSTFKILVLLDVLVN